MVQVQSVNTSVSNLVVTPQTTAVSVSFTTNNAVRAQLQVGPSSGTYPNKFTIDSAAAISHLLSGFGLTANTVYHYILQFYDAFGATLDATADATFTTLTAPASGSAAGAIIGLLLGGNGVPTTALGPDGAFYFRYDGTTGAFIYHRAAGAWTAVI